MVKNHIIICVLTGSLCALLYVPMVKSYVQHPVQLLLQATNSKKTRHHSKRAWMDENDLLQIKCKGNRQKFESMKRKLEKVGRARKDPDMESDAENNMQYKPLQHDEDSSDTENELKSSATATGTGSADADTLKKQIDNMFSKKAPKTAEAKEPSKSLQTPEDKEEERRQQAEKDKK